MRGDFGQMRVNERSPDRLRLSYVEWFPGALIGVVGLALVYAGTQRLLSGAAIEGIAVLLFTALPAFIICAVTTRKVTLVLDGRLGIVHVHNGPVFRRTVRSAPLARLQGAETETDHDSAAPMERVILLFDDRPAWRITNRASAGEGPRSSATVINTWLASHTNPIDSMEPSA
jgi:hypothetical protein